MFGSGWKTVGRLVTKMFLMGVQLVAVVMQVHRVCYVVALGLVTREVCVLLFATIITPLTGMFMLDFELLGQSSHFLLPYSLG